MTVQVDRQAPGVKLGALVERLEARGVVVTKVWPVDEWGDQDGGVDLATGEHVQLGEGYALIFGPAPAGAILGPLVAELETDRPDAVVQVLQTIKQGGRT